jgi:Zn-finger nucleic acid-binding protein
MELIESRRYLQCRHCGAFHFPDGIEAEGIRVTGAVANAPDCPRCNSPLLHGVLDNDYAVDLCGTCRGVLMPRENFAAVVSMRRAWASNPPAEPVRLDPGQLQRKLTCPVCRGRFETFAYAGPGNVVIDNCVRCDLVWLDYGELRQIVDAPGRDRGRQRHRTSSEQ